MKTITGTFQNADGTPVANGKLWLRLSQDAVAVGTAQVAPALVLVQLNSSGQIPGSTNIFFNDELSPAGTTYTASVVAAGGGLAWGAESISVSGASFNFNNAIPTSSSVVFADAVLKNPGVDQTIVSGNLTLASTLTFFVNNIKQQVGAPFLVSDPNGQSHFFISNSAPYVNTFVQGNGTGGVFLGSAAKTAVADTTGNILTAGTITVQKSDGTLGAIIANDTSGGINLTSSGGNTINLGLGGFLNLLTLGAQVTLKGATSGTIGLQAAAIAGSNTLTFPAATDTLVGRATVDNLINKNMLLAQGGNTISVLNAQGATGVLTGNSTDQVVYTYTLPANQVNSTSNGVRITCSGTHSSGTANVTCKININGVNVVSGAIGTTVSQSVSFQATILRTASTTGESMGINTTAGALNPFSVTLAGLAWTSNQTITFTFNVANTDQFTGRMFLVEQIQ